MVLEKLAESGVVTHLMGEMFPVLEAFGKPALLPIEKVAEIVRETENFKPNCL